MDSDLAQALQTVESKLHTVNDELAPQEHEVAELRARLDPLERKVTTLQQKRDALAAAAGNLRVALEMAGPTAAAFSSDSDDGLSDRQAVEDWLSNGEGTDHGPRPRTVDGVVAILTELGGMGTLEDIRRAFREREWLDPSFKDPDAALYAATKRLSDRGRIERLGGGQYRLIPEHPNGEVQEAGMP
jgi:hypothetical protein